MNEKQQQQRKTTEEPWKGERQNKEKEIERDSTYRVIIEPCSNPLNVSSGLSISQALLGNPNSVESSEER